MKTLNKIARLVLILTAITSLSYAQNPAPAAPSLSDEAKAVLLSDYKSVLLEQKKVKERVDKFNEDYNKYLAGLPKGSSIAVNADVDSVEVTAPAAPKAEEKPAEPVKK